MRTSSGAIRSWRSGQPAARASSTPAPHRLRHKGRCRHAAGQGRPDGHRRHRPISTPSPRPRSRPAPITSVTQFRRAAPGRDPGVGDAGIRTIVCITEGVPALDMISVVEAVRRAGARLIRAPTPGRHVARPGQSGHHPASIHKPGRVGVVSRSGTLTYEAVQAMTDAGWASRTCVGIGGDPIIGTTFSTSSSSSRDPGHRRDRA